MQLNGKFIINKSSTLWEKNTLSHDSRVNILVKYYYNHWVSLLFKRQHTSLIHITVVDKLFVSSFCRYMMRVMLSFSSDLLSPLSRVRIKIERKFILEWVNIVIRVFTTAINHQKAHVHWINLSTTVKRSEKQRKTEREWWTFDIIEKNTYIYKYACTVPLRYQCKIQDISQKVTSWIIKYEKFSVNQKF